MSRSLQKYHPSQILKDKRLKLRSELSDLSEKVTVEEVAAQAMTSVGKFKRPTNELGQIVFDALDYLFAAKVVLDQVKKYLDELQVVVKECLAADMADKDRKMPNRKFQAIKKSILDLTKTADVKGDLLFSGRFRDKPKMIRIGKGAEEEVAMRIEPLNLEFFYLDRAKVDNLPAAKKSVEYLAKATLVFEEIYVSFVVRIDPLESKLERILQVAESESNSDAGGVKVKKNSDFKMQDLKRKQENAAEHFDREIALLLNILV